MGRFSDYLASQCGNPRGAIGKTMTWAMNRVNGFMYNGIVKNLYLSEDTKILDIGFGNGYLESLIYRKAKCSVYGIDISDDMVKAASEKNKNGIKNGDIHLSVGDCCDLAFENRSFDIVTTMNTIYFWNDTLRGLQEIYRVLNDTGIFYNAVLTKEGLDKMFYTKNGFKKFENHEYAEMGQKVGFQKISFRHLGKYGLLIIYEK
ncbi:MAG: class I SAM-dependent methyltransferase [Ruminococcus sp.]|nr:class I SAM-dependent methyltransferase [Ruminococcus sp.]